ADRDGSDHRAEGRDRALHVDQRKDVHVPLADRRASDPAARRGARDVHEEIPGEARRLVWHRAEGFRRGPGRTARSHRRAETVPRDQPRIWGASRDQDRHQTCCRPCSRAAAGGEALTRVATRRWKGTSRQSVEVLDLRKLLSFSIAVIALTL